MYISIIMATYNGEKFIREQLDSIVPYLEEGDELLVSDDGSTDATIQIINEYASRFRFIRITEGQHTGSTSNFSSAISKCKGDIILFSDQDDVWMPNKIKMIRYFFEKNSEVKLIMHNAGYCDKNGSIIDGDIFSRRNPKHGFYTNLLHSTYYGCCMAAKKSFLMNYIPIADSRIPYDQYFSLFAEKNKQVAFINEKLILHRYHGENQSRKTTFFDKIIFRIRLWKNVKLVLKNISKKSRCC